MKILERFSFKLKHENEVDFALWSKRLLNTFWYMCLIILIGTIILFIGLVINGEYEIKFKDMSYFEYIIVYVAIPFLLIAAIILSSSAALVFLGKRNQYTLQAFVCLFILPDLYSVNFNHNTLYGKRNSYGIFICMFYISYLCRS